MLISAGEDMLHKQEYILMSTGLLEYMAPHITDLILMWYLVVRLTKLHTGSAGEQKIQVQTTERKRTE